MNLQIPHVISDLTGTKGLAMVDAILAGERDPAKLAELRDPRIKASEETMRPSWVGNGRGEHLFTLKPSREAYPFCLQQMVACELEIEKLWSQFEPRVDPAEKPRPPDRKRKRSEERKRKKTGPTTGFDLRSQAYKLFGVDVTQIPGVAAIA